MANIEKAVADEILRSGGASPSKLGLRFDRVVVRVLGDLRSFAERAAPKGVTVLVTISAPIRLPAKTSKALEGEITTLLAAGVPRAERNLAVHGNDVRVRLVEHGSSRRLIGFVHNRGAAAEQLLDLAERWLRAAS